MKITFKLRNFFYFTGAIFKWIGNILDKYTLVQKYYVYVPSANKPIHIHNSYEDAYKEAVRLATTKISSMEKIQILQIVGEINGDVIRF